MAEAKRVSAAPSSFLVWLRRAAPFVLPYWMGAAFLGNINASWVLFFWSFIAVLLLGRNPERRWRGLLFIWLGPALLAYLMLHWAIRSTAGQILLLGLVLVSGSTVAGKIFDFLLVPSTFEDPYGLLQGAALSFAPVTFVLAVGGFSLGLVLWSARLVNRKALGPEELGLHLAGGAVALALLFAYKLDADFPVIITLFLLPPAAVFFGVLWYRYFPLRESGGAALLLVALPGAGGSLSRLARRLAMRWTERGSLTVLAPTELAPRLAGLDTWYRFLYERSADKLATKNTIELEQRLTTLDQRPDPDGLFRVNDCFCTPELWGEAVSRLTAKHHVVLLDLRGPATEEAVTATIEVFRRVPRAKLLVVTYAPTTTLVSRLSEHLTDIETVHLTRRPSFSRYPSPSYKDIQTLMERLGEKAASPATGDGSESSEHGIRAPAA